MIPQIQEVNFPAYATLHQATVSLTEMGDRVITTQIRIDGDVVPDFEGWELRFRGERFILPIREPQAAKDNSTRNSIVDLTFYSWAIYEMKRYFFIEMASTESGTAIADKYNASLALSVEPFVDAFNNVLSYYFGDKIRMDLFQKGQGIYSGSVALFEINYTHIWDVLVKFFEVYNLRWVLEYDSTNDVHVIKVGYPASAIEDHDFEYGYSGGLVRFERQVQEDDITNILLGRGGENNLPYRYFKRTDENNPDWAADPDAIPELKNINFDRLRDINFRWYVRGWMHNPKRDTSWEQRGYAYPTYTITEDSTYYWAYQRGLTDELFNPVEYVKDDDSIEKYGEHWGALDDNDEIYPTIQGVDRNGIGRVDEVIAVSEIITDDIGAAATYAAKEFDLRGTRQSLTVKPASSYTLDIRGEDFEVPEGQTANLIMSGTWLKEPVRGSKRATGSNRGTVNIEDDDPVNYLIRVDTERSYVEVYDKMSGAKMQSNNGLPSGSYYYSLHVRIESEFTSADYASVMYTVGVSGMHLILSGGEGSEGWKPTFDIWVKNLWNTEKLAGESDEDYAIRVWRPILGDHFGNDAKIAFSDGFMSISEDYEFVIASYPTFDQSKELNGVVSEWRITLFKSDAEFEATGLYVPNSKTGGKPSSGDHFYFLGIDMPHYYVEWAEERLNGYKGENLVDLSEISPTWIVQLDKVRVHTLEEAEYGSTLAERLTTGGTIRTKDKRFTRGAVLTLYVQSITYTWNEPSENNPYIVPEIEVVLSNKPASVEGTVDKIQSDIDIIKSTYVKTADIESTIRKVSSALYLKKTGESDSSASPTTFSSRVTSANFRQGDVGGEGWGAYLDDEGKAVYEVDKLVVRDELRVNSLVANQITYVGGKQIFSAAAIECIKVVETDEGYVCFFDQKQGSVANLFVVGDIAFGQVFDPKNIEERYYKRLVTEIGEDYITLSKEEHDGDGVPQAGDSIIQYGNETDVSRQYVIIRDVIGGGYERMLSDLNSVSSAGKEYYFAGMTNRENYNFVGLRDVELNDLTDLQNRFLGYRNYKPKHRWFIGDKDGEFAEWVDGSLTIKGSLIVKNTSGSYSSLADYSDTVDYLRAALPKDDSGQITTINGGIVLSTIIGVQTGGSLVAGINSSQIGNSAEHGKLMIFAGANGAANVGSAKFRVYEDGHVVANDFSARGADISGKITATSGTIGGFSISDSYIGRAETDLGDGLSLFDNSISFRGGNLNNGTSFAALGANTVSAAVPMNVLSRFETSGGYGYFSGVGALYDIQGFENNYAILCTNGQYAGLRPATVKVTDDYTLTGYDNTVFVESTYGSAITISLPADPKIGQIYFIIIPIISGATDATPANQDVTINGNGKQINRVVSQSSVSSWHHTQFRGMDILIYSGSRWYMIALEP